MSEQKAITINGRIRGFVLEVEGDSEALRAAGAAIVEKVAELFGGAAPKSSQGDDGYRFGVE